ncbi:hypothetical protein HK405_014157, partial [Cladochytrium tenue]
GLNFDGLLAEFAHEADAVKILHVLKEADFAQSQCLVVGCLREIFTPNGRKAGRKPNPASSTACQTDGVPDEQLGYYKATNRKLKAKLKDLLALHRSGQAAAARVASAVAASPAAAAAATSAA